jgi:hypothetical protein
MKPTQILIIGIAILALLCMPVMASYAPLYESKIAPVPTDAPTLGNNAGLITISVIAGSNTFSQDVIIQRINASIPFSSGSTVSKAFAESYEINGPNTTVTLGDAGYVGTNVVAGDYRITLVDGDGGMSEYALVHVEIGHRYSVTFVGHAVSSPYYEDKACVPVYTIEKASYCGVTIPAVTHVVHHAAVQPTPAYYTVEQAEWIPAVTHTVHHAATMATGQPCNSYTPGHVHAKKNSGQTDFTYNGNNYHITGNSQDSTFIVTPGTPAWDETIVDVPAHWNGNCEETYGGNYDFKVNGQKYRFDENGDDVYTFHPATQGSAAWDETIVDTSAVEGGCAQVTQNVQQAVSAGATRFMLFNNAKNPGGIFDIGQNLVSQIDDPAVSIVKDVTITYNNGCGIERTITGKEYQIIDLVAGTISTPA